MRRNGDNAVTYAEAMTTSGRNDAATRRGEGPGTAVRFTLLGPVEVSSNGEDLAPTAPKVLQLLAMLLSCPRQIVPTDAIIRELWASEPPRSVRKTLHIYIHHLRRSLDALGRPEGRESILVTKSPGYLLWIDPARVDVTQFRALREQGRVQLRGKDYPAAADSLRSALELWAGPPLANVRCGPVLSAYALELREQRRSTQQLRIEAEINLGMAGELVGELRGLVAADPLDEGCTGQLIQVLHHCGRRSEAMAAYRELRTRLNRELGVEPCDELRQLHRDLLLNGENP